jgi:TRAP transporter TAXI family solute receptor
MPRLLKDLKILLLTNFWVIPVIAALVGALFFFVTPPPPMSASLATGPEDGGYYEFGKKLQAELAGQGFELTLVSSRGSRDNLQRLLDEDGDVSLAMVQSGLEQQLDLTQRQRLQSLGALFKEPLWLFTRKDLKFEHLSDLRDRRLGLGSPQSGTREVTQAILQANGLEAADYPQGWEETGGSKAASALQAGKLDAAFFVAAAESPLLQQLAADPQLRLVGMPRTRSYAVRIPFLKPLDVSEGLLDMLQNTPQQDILTLSPVATLVINEDFHPALVPLILQAAREVMQQGSLLDAPGAYPSAEPPTFALSPDAAHYYAKGLPLLQRYLPFRIASLADRYIILLIPLLMVLIPLFKAIGPIYQWRIRARIYRWYKYLREIDQQLHENTLPEKLDEEIARLEELEEQLARVEVPLSYSNELYELHLHVRYVISRLQTLRQRQDQVG